MLNAKWSAGVKVSGEAGLYAFVLVTVGALSLIPFMRLLLEGMAPGGTFDLGVAAEVLGSGSTWRALWRSLWTAAGGTALSLIIGVPFAILVALTDLRAKVALVFCFMLPLMIPPQITALSWVQLFGPSSALLQAVGMAPPLGSPHPLYSAEGIMALLGVQHAPLVFLAVRSGLRGLPREMVEAARCSGAAPLRVMREIVLPLMTPPLVAGAALAFVSSIGNFGISAILGIPVGYATLPVLIYQRLAGFGPTIISEVAILSIVIGVVAFTGVVVQNRLTRGRDFRTVGAGSKALALPLGRARPAVETACWMVIFIILVAPLTALVSTSLVPSYGVPLSIDSATIEAYREVVLRQSVTVRAFTNSMGLALGAAVALTLVAVPLGYLVVFRRHSKLVKAANLAAELPYALPGVVLSIACILVFLKPLPLIGISLYGTIWIIFIAYLARFLTLALRPVVAGFSQLDPHLEEAAQVSGAGLIYRLRTIMVPIIAPVTAAGAILVFMTAFNEITVSALLWSSGTETLGVLVYNLDDGGYTEMATALAVLIVAAIVALMGLAQILARRLPTGVLPWQT
ncbi:MAG: iron ABC transporter permease [Chromatiales bacterium]|jgi:iron(III) transport system permease protein|nr:iron ABC transporter permease [Chromatiales bacterium]